MNKKIISLLLVCLCTFGINCPVHAEEEYDSEWDYTEEYTENEYYDEYYYNEEENENDDYTAENYDNDTEYYEETQETVTQESYIEESYMEETPVTEEISVIEEISNVEESVVSEISPESSEEKSVVSEAAKIEPSVDEVTEESEMPENPEPKILNLAFTARKEEPTTNRISGTALWGIMFVLTVFSIVFFPRTRGIEFIKDRYRCRKAKKITKRHIR